MEGLPRNSWLNLVFNLWCEGPLVVPKKGGSVLNGTAIRNRSETTTSVGFLKPSHQDRFRFAVPEKSADLIRAPHGSRRHFVEFFQQRRPEENVDGVLERMFSYGIIRAVNVASWLVWGPPFPPNNTYTIFKVERQEKYSQETKIRT